jgi:hypothetical protein
MRKCGRKFRINGGLDHGQLFLGDEHKADVSVPCAKWRRMSRALLLYFCVNLVRRVVPSVLFVEEFVESGGLASAFEAERRTQNLRGDEGGVA